MSSWGPAPTSQDEAPSRSLPLPTPLAPPSRGHLGLLMPKLTWATQVSAWAGGVGVHHVHTTLGLLALEGR